MRCYNFWFVALASFALSPALQIQAEPRRANADVVGEQAPRSEDVVLVGRVQAVHPPRLITVENRLAPQRQLLVLVPGDSPLPAAGAIVQARGQLRRLERAELGTGAFSGLDQRTQEGFAGQSVLVAQSLGRVDETAASFDRPALPAAAMGAIRQEITVHSPGLASLIEELAGFQVRVPYARVVDLIDSRAFLIDSAVSRRAFGQRDRVLVLVDAGMLRVPEDTLRSSTVIVEGSARTILGLQASGAMPPQLDPDELRRLDVRAAVVATSVRTADGVELTDR